MPSDGAKAGKPAGYPDLVFPSQEPRISFSLTGTPNEGLEPWTLCGTEWLGHI